MELDRYIRDQIADKQQKYYVFIDEIQKVSEIQNPYEDDANAKIGFVDVLLGLMKIKNVDLYVTGSNSRMLSTDILTEFKDRGDEIRVNPLTYSEFYSALEGEKRHAWREYYTYGGMPLVLSKKTHEEKSKYLKDLFAKTYISDVLEHNRILNEQIVLEDLLNIVSSAVGSLTNPTKLSNTFQSVKQMSVSSYTIGKYLDYFIDAFLMYKALCYDIKGKRYIETPLKYYFTDVGLRNARLNFRQQEENHIMENIIFNEQYISTERKKVMSKIMIASDIHGSAYYCRLMLDRFKEENAERLVLLGDILYHGPRNDLPKEYAPKEVIAMLNPLRNKIICVRGNCDTEVDQMVLDFNVLAEQAYLNFNDRSIVLAHGHKLDEKNIPALKEGDILLCGHTHVPKCEKRDNYIYMNPGSVSIPKENSEHSYMILDDKFYWKNLDGEEYMEY